MGLGTLAIHMTDLHNETHAHALPIYQTSTYVFDGVEHGQSLWRGEQPGHIYSRLGNPNTQATADAIAALEGVGLSERPLGLLTGSGMAAVSTVALGLARVGETILSQRALYGASHTLFHQHLNAYGIQHATFDGHDLDDLEAALERHDSISMVYIESPANPTMKLTDVCGAVKLAHGAGIPVVMDNTFATPYLQQPLKMGVDVVLHSTTKYLTGHGTVVGGAVVTPHEDLFRDKLMPVLKTFGAVAGPMDAWLTSIGMKTLHVRMARHCENGMAVARFLEAHPAIEKVYYPGLESFEQYDLARTQMSDFGGMMSFELKGGYEAGAALMDNVQLATLAVSLGTVDTLIQHPASMTHFKNPPAVRAEMGISDGLVRLSVGIEDVDDIIADLEQALDA
ncbi:MAG: PLP-dependent transferase, partial [Chloroflexi bacterium]|nr:PLP-dependent transferase [Chloroflexota bacterium]